MLCVVGIVLHSHCKPKSQQFVHNSFIFWVQIKPAEYCHEFRWLLWCAWKMQFFITTTEKNTTTNAKLLPTTWNPLKFMVKVRNVWVFQHFQKVKSSFKYDTFGFFFVCNTRSVWFVFSVLGSRVSKIKKKNEFFREKSNGFIDEGFAEENGWSYLNSNKNSAKAQQFPTKLKIYRWNEYSAIFLPLYITISILKHHLIKSSSACNFKNKKWKKENQWQKAIKKCLVSVENSNIIYLKYTQNEVECGAENDHFPFGAANAISNYLIMALN